MWRDALETAWFVTGWPAPVWSSTVAPCETLSAADASSARTGETGLRAMSFANRLRGRLSAAIVSVDNNLEL